MDLNEALDVFASATTIPVEAITWTLEHWEEAFPRIAPLLDIVTDPDQSSEADESTLFFLLHLAAEKGDTRVHDGLCRMLLDPEVPEVVLGDGTTETLSGLLISTYDGDPAPMQAVLESAQADEYVRGAVLMALAWLTHAGRLTHDWMRDYLRRLFAEMEPRDSHMVWVDWVTAVAALGYEDFVPQAEDLFGRAWIDPGVLEPQDFQADLQATLAAPHEEPVFRAQLAKPFTDTIGTLEHWGFGDTSDEDGWLTEPDNQVPYVNPMRDVGRNDPCPCGSGKKYKKCCLAA